MTEHIDFSDLDALEAKLGREALVLLRDQLLQRLPTALPHSIARTQSTAEMLADRRRKSFDETHASPTEGPIAEAAKRFDAWRADYRASCDMITELGRFYVERHSYQHQRRWRIMDRLSDKPVYFAITDPMQPEVLHKIASQAEAVALMEKLHSYFSSLGIRTRAADDGGEKPAKAPQERTRVTQSLWRAFSALLPPSRPPSFGTPRLDDRVALSAMIWVLVTGHPGKDLPTSIGAGWKACLRRIRQWQATDKWPLMKAAIDRAFPELTVNDWRIIESFTATGLDASFRAYLIDTVESYLRVSRTPASRLGQASINDAAFVRKLRGGRAPRRETCNRVIDYIAAQRA